MVRILISNRTGGSLQTSISRILIQRRWGGWPTLSPCWRLHQEGAQPFRGFYVHFHCAGSSTASDEVQVAKAIETTQAKGHPHNVLQTLRKERDRAAQSFSKGPRREVAPGPPFPPRTRKGVGTLVCGDPSYTVRRKGRPPACVTQWNRSSLLFIQAMHNSPSCSEYLFGRS